MQNTELSRTDRRKLRTRQALKDAAAQLLIEKGYETLTIQDITDRLDLARATFYLYFRDKDDVIWAIVQDSLDELTSTLTRDLPRELENRHYLKLQRVFQYAATNQEILKVMLGERGHIRLASRLANYMADIIQRDIEAGLVQVLPTSTVPSPLRAQFLAGATMQLLVWWLERPQEYTAEKLAGMFHQLEVGSEAPWT